MPHAAPTSGLRQFDALSELLAAGDALVLAGAGISTASGIPDEQRASCARSHVRTGRSALPMPDRATDRR